MPKVSKVFKWRHMLPNTYQRVEYIQSNPTNPGTATGTYQYINTGYNPTLNTEISIDIQLTNIANQSTLFGGATSNTSYLSFISYVNGSNHWARYMRNGNSGNPTDTGVTVDTNRHTFVVNKTTYKIYTDGVQVYSGTSTNSPTTNGNIPLYLFADNGDGTPGIVSAAKLYSCKIWDNGTLVRDFIPCYRRSDSVIGLYDLVGKTFYTNQGTGSFTKGSDVSDLIEYQVYPSGDTPTPTITETHRFSEGGTSLYKQGYKIKEIELQFTCYYSSTARQSSSFGIVDPNKSNADYRSIFRTGGEWHYSGYVDNGMGMVGGWRLNGSENYVIKFASNATVKQGGSCILKFNEGGGNIKVGTTFGTWIQDDDFVHTATIQTFVNSLFTSQTIAIASGAGGATISNDLMTVTYEPV